MGKHRAPATHHARIPHALVGAVLALGALAGQAGASYVEQAITPAQDVRPVVVDAR